MKVTGNKVKAKIAVFHDIDPAKVVMNALYWEILAIDHAALVWYGIKGDAYDLPYAAVAIEEEVYINESSRLDKSSDIPASGKVWIRLSDGSTFDGKELMEFVENAKTNK